MLDVIITFVMIITTILIFALPEITANIFPLW